MIGTNHLALVTPAVVNLVAHSQLNIKAVIFLRHLFTTAGGVVSAPLHNQPNKIQTILAHLLHRLLAFRF
jgi:hypothetical protein